MSTKGSWHRKHDKSKYDEGFDRVFGKKKKPVQDKKQKVTFDETRKAHKVS